MMSKNSLALQWILTTTLVIVFSVGCLPPAGLPVHVGGQISGLDEGETVELSIRMMGTSYFPEDFDEAKVFVENGEFKFDGTLPATPLTFYNVRVTGYPSGKLCSVENFKGIAFPTHITNVHVNCAEPLIAGLLDAVGDERFANCVNEQVAADPNDNDLAENVTEIDCQGLGIQQVSGLAFFPNLQTLVLENNFITSADLSGANALLDLNLNENQLQSINLPALPNLEFLEMQDNFFQHLIVHNMPALIFLYMSFNELESLDLENLPNLRYLHLSGNELDSIDLGNLPSLRSVLLSGNNFLTLDLTNVPSLQSLTMNDYSEQGDDFYSVDLTGNPELRSLELENHKLTSIDLSGNPKLFKVGLRSNQLTSIDLSSIDDLSSLFLNDNNLTSVDLSKFTEMGWVDLRENQLTSVDLSNMVVLHELYLQDNLLTDLTNIPLQNLQPDPIITYSDATISLQNNPWDAAARSAIVEFSRSASPYAVNY